MCTNKYNICFYSFIQLQTDVSAEVFTWGALLLRLFGRCSSLLRSPRSLFCLFAWLGLFDEVDQGLVLRAPVRWIWTASLNGLFFWRHVRRRIPVLLLFHCSSGRYPPRLFLDAVVFFDDFAFFFSDFLRAPMSCAKGTLSSELLSAAGASVKKHTHMGNCLN